MSEIAGMGPPPKPAGTRARRNASPQTTTLSASGRRGKKAPAWPLRPDQSLVSQLRVEELKSDRLRGELLDADDRKAKRLQQQLDESTVKAMVLGEQIAEQASMEAALWAELWSTPQAAMWEKFGWSREVAAYVRLTIRGELGDLDAGKEARQWSDRLGLNPLAMLRLRWEIERTDEAEQRGRQRRGAQPAPARKQAAADPRSVLRAVK